MVEAMYDSHVLVVFAIFSDAQQTRNGLVGVLGLEEEMSGTGQSDIENSSIAQYIGLSEWRLERLLPKRSLLRWKLCLVDPHSRLLTHHEAVTRELAVGEIPVHVHVAYESSHYELRTLTASLSNTGQLVSLPTQRFMFHPEKDDEKPGHTDTPPDGLDLEDEVFFSKAEQDTQNHTASKDQPVSITGHDTLAVPEVEHQNDFETFPTPMKEDQEETRVFVPVALFKPASQKKTWLEVPDVKRERDFENKIIKFEDSRDKADVALPQQRSLNQVTALKLVQERDSRDKIVAVGVDQAGASVGAPKVPPKPIQKKKIATPEVSVLQRRKDIENAMAGTVDHRKKESVFAPVSTDTTKTIVPQQAEFVFPAGPSGVQRQMVKTATKSTATDPIILRIDDRTDFDFHQISKFVHEPEHAASAGTTNTKGDVQRKAESEMELQFADTTSELVDMDLEMYNFIAMSADTSDGVTRDNGNSAAKCTKDYMDFVSVDENRDILNNVLGYAIPCLLGFVLAAGVFYRTRH